MFQIIVQKWHTLTNGMSWGWDYLLFWPMEVKMFEKPFWKLLCLQISFDAMGAEVTHFSFKVDVLATLLTCATELDRLLSLKSHISPKTLQRHVSTPDICKTKCVKWLTVGLVLNFLTGLSVVYRALGCHWDKCDSSWNLFHWYLSGGSIKK